MESVMEPAALEDQIPMIMKSVGVFDDLPPPPPPGWPQPKKALPLNWKYARNPSGMIYYYNCVTKETQWDPPGPESDDLSRGAASEQSVMDKPTTRHNQETQWDPPESDLEVLSRDTAREQSVVEKPTTQHNQETLVYGMKTNLESKFVPVSLKTKASTSAADAVSDSATVSISGDVPLPGEVSKLGGGFRPVAALTTIASNTSVVQAKPAATSMHATLVFAKEDGTTKAAILFVPKRVVEPTKSLSVSGQEGNEKMNASAAEHGPALKFTKTVTKQGEAFKVVPELPVSPRAKDSVVTDTLDIQPPREKSCFRSSTRKDHKLKPLKFKESLITNDMCTQPQGEKEAPKSAALQSYKPSQKKGHFKCNFCIKCFTNEATLIRHKVIHEKNHFQCSICQMSFTQKSSLNRHTAVHTGEKRFQCSTCGKVFRSKETLQGHERLHTGNLACSYCEKTLMTKRHLNRHLWTHQEHKPFKCTKCEKKFRTSTHLRRHALFHTDERPFHCSQCDKRFKEKRALKVHLKFHEGEKPYKCSRCQKSYRSLSHLEVHFRNHTGERPFKCTWCEKSFTTAQVLARHVRNIHTGDKPYVCSFCGAGFKQSYNCQVHERIHTGEEPFKCSLCRKSFRSKASLDGHVCNQTDEKPSLI